MAEKHKTHRGKHHQGVCNARTQAAEWYWQGKLGEALAKREMEAGKTPMAKAKEEKDQMVLPVIYKSWPVSGPPISLPCYENQEEVMNILRRINWELVIGWLIILVLLAAFWYFVIYWFVKLLAKAQGWQ